MSKAKLMLVEDDKHLLLGLREILELAGYTVDIAENGREALDLLNTHAQNPPDLIVSDIMMPYMDGIELLRHVREQERWVNIPFVFLTARGEKTDIHLGKHLGVDEYVVKPFDTDDLLVVIESRLKRHRDISEANTKIINLIKRQILTILNHEFRTPLTLVVAYADMLNDVNEANIQSADPRELLDFLRGVSSGAQRLRRLIENFILLVEMENGDTNKTFAWRSRRVDDLRDIIEDVPKHVGMDTSTHQIVFEIGKLPPILADREFLVIALRELLSNALKFSPEGSTVTVKAEQVGDEVRIIFTDQGRGISEEELKHIWEPFYQADRQRFEDQGAGSGLTIARGLIEMHHGFIEVESTPNQGSSFSVFLPVHKP